MNAPNESEVVPAVEGLQRDEADEGSARGAWFPRLVSAYLRRRYREGAKARIGASERSAADRAEWAIKRACALSAMTGATSGAISTAAEILTAETEGIAGLVTLPTAAVTIGGEMVFRSWVHLRLTCDLADIFDVRIDPDDPSDLWRLYALAFKTEEHAAESEDPGHDLVHRVVHVESEQVGEKIGVRLRGESIVRNLVPVASVVTSSWSNWRMTRHVGDTVRRYMRYHRALEDALEHAEAACSSVLDLLLEGIWHLFTADGRLSSEEAALLANVLRKLPAAERGAVMRRFTDDEHDWSERIQAIPEPVREPFLRALEVAAAVDKSVSLPERKILRRAARKLGLGFDLSRVEGMIKEFDERGVVALG